MGRVVVAVIMIIAATDLSAGSVLAGMRPAPMLTDIAKTRIEVISFFALALLLLALPVKWAWNLLGRDFTRLPRITYLRSLALVVLWGLLFIIVLAMISGARELMTPGAWEKKPTGGYRLADATASDSPTTDNSPEKRRARLEWLYRSIQAYRERHGGYPPHDYVDEIGQQIWESPHPSRQRYIYVPLPSESDTAATVLAVEPACYGEKRLVLWANGRIEESDAYWALREMHGGRGR